MRALDFTQVQLNEAIPILNISSWFDQKAKNKRVGAAQIKKFTNEHENAFMNFMGLQRVDWPTVTMYVIYRYLTLKMKLKNNDVVSVVNEVLRDLMADAKIKTLSLEQIQDVNKELKVTNLTNGARNAGQKIAEMIIASGALRQLERHWEDEEKVDDEEKIGQAKTQTEPAATFGLSKEAVENAISLIQQGDEQAALTILRQSIGASTAQNNTKSKVTLQQAQSTSKKQAQSVPHPTQPDKATPTSNADTIPIKIPGRKIENYQRKVDGDKRNWINTATGTPAGPGLAKELDTEWNSRNNGKSLEESIRKLRKILETASSGSTASGSIASVANPMGATISRTPNLFGYVPYQSSVKLKKRKKQPKNTS